MKTIHVKTCMDVPENFTGIAVWSNGDKEWYKEGNLHREDGPAIECPDGNKYWYKEGKKHREDGPAIIYLDGTKHWFKEGNLHREDGPASKYSNGDKEWYLQNVEYFRISLKDYLILDYSEGECGLMWYKLLDKDQIIECPDIPGLITK